MRKGLAFEPGPFEFVVRRAPELLRKHQNNSSESLAVTFLHAPPHAPKPVGLQIRP